MATQEWREANAERMKAYRRSWYERNSESAKVGSALKRKEYRERNARILREAKAKPCTDCHIEYPPYVMHFDHLGDDKDTEVSKMAWVPVSEARLRAEIAKCEVVCGNCHAERTWGSGRSLGA